MNFIEKPNLPEKNVKVVLIDGRIDRGIEEGLFGLGITPVKTGLHTGLYDAVSFHPDMLFHHLGGTAIVHAPGVESRVLESLARYGFELIQGATELSPEYPKNIAYNAARVGNFVVHNLKYTDKILLEELEKRKLKFIHVNQGYAKCSIAVVDSASIITSDAGIARAVEKEGIEVLLIEPENIVLPGLDRGFIGGSSGLVSSGKLAFSGCFESLKAKDKIKEFFVKKGLESISLSNGPIIDIGSILPLIEE